MKYLPLLIICALTMSVIVVSRRFTISGAVLLYLWVSFAVNFTLLFGLQKNSVYQGYYEVFLALAVINGVVSMNAAIDLCAVLRRGHFVGLFCAAGALGIILALIFADYITDAYKGHLYPESKVALLEATLHLVLGIAILASLAAPLDNLGIALRLSLGSYMLLRGVIVFGFAMGVVRYRSLWLSLNDWLPMLPGILCLGLLLVWLCFGQSDLVHQETPSAAIQQGHAVAVEMEQ